MGAAHGGKQNMTQSAHDVQSHKTRRDLINTAIRLMARDGISAVSLRTVNAQAGSLNASAAHYHFGGKSGLVEAALRHVFEPVVAKTVAQLEALDQRAAAGEEVTVRMVLEALSLPFLSLMIHPDYGPDACRFVGRFMFEADDTMQQQLNGIVVPMVSRAAPALAACLPHLPPDVVVMRLMLLPLTIGFGPTNAAVIANSPLGNLMPQEPIEVVHRVLEYLEGALTQPSTPHDPELAARMAAAMPQAKPKP